MADERHDLGEQRQLGAHDRIALDHALPGGGADRDRVAVLAHAGEIGDAGDVDKPRRPGEPHRHQRNQRLPAGESGPNNIDIHGVGTNVPGYEVSWNCYDRLISHEMKTANGVPYYDRDKFKPELAEDMNVGDMSVTFKLKKNATFHDGTPVTAKDVKWSLDRAVTVGGFPTFQMKARAR